MNSRISDEKVLERGIEYGFKLYGPKSANYGDQDHLLERALEELESEDLAHWLQEHGSASQYIALSGDERGADLAWRMMRMLVPDDEGLYYDKALYFGDWEVVYSNSMWELDHLCSDLTIITMDLGLGLDMVEGFETMEQSE